MYFPQCQEVLFSTYNVKTPLQGLGLPAPFPQVPGAQQALAVSAKKQGAYTNLAFAPHLYATKAHIVLLQAAGAMRSMFYDYRSE